MAEDLLPEGWVSRELTQEDSDNDPVFSENNVEVGTIVQFPETYAYRGYKEKAACESSHQGQCGVCLDNGVYVPCP